MITLTNQKLGSLVKGLTGTKKLDEYKSGIQCFQILAVRCIWIHTVFLGRGL